MDPSLSAWMIFCAIVAALLIFDLGLWHRGDKEISVQESLRLSLIYFVVSLAFGTVLLFGNESKDGSDFFTGYFVEKSLSLDNIFIMSMVFEHFHIPNRYQHRVLFWGILGAIIMRGLMIFFGVTLINAFHPILYLFGGFLLITGGKMLFLREEDKTLEENKLLKLLKRHIRVSDQLHGNKFFIKENAIKIATPLFLTLVFIELGDVVFAVDSVPAVLAVTTDPFIVYTSNIFAILGLRALYFALSNIIHRFEYLKYSLALVLIFIGGKIFLNKIFLMPSLISLGITIALLAGGICLSLYKTRHK